MTEPGRKPHEDDIAATAQFRRFVAEDLSAEVEQGRDDRTKKLVLLVAAIVLVVAIVVVIALLV